MIESGNNSQYLLCFVVVFDIVVVVVYVDTQAQALSSKDTATQTLARAQDFRGSQTSKHETGEIYGVILPRISNKIFNTFAGEVGHVDVSDRETHSW